MKSDIHLSLTSLSEKKIEVQGYFIYRVILSYLHHNISSMLSRLKTHLVVCRYKRFANLSKKLNERVYNFLL